MRMPFQAQYANIAQAYRSALIEFDANHPEIIAKINIEKAAQATAAKQSRAKYLNTPEGIYKTLGM